MFASSSFGEKGGKGIISGLFIRRHSTVGLDSMLETIELPASIADLVKNELNRLNGFQNVEDLLGHRLGQHGWTDIHAF